ncbi:hypothetical protein BS17DRAFT_759993 [Gyrodon lividus]|nr:hypothetical protein BS17DRAFT_759993 [Gyrodon lividus]
MSDITKIANIETATAIWEFDPSLPDNRILGDSLDVVAAVHTLAIKIQCSGQRIEYFETLQVKCGIETPLSIPLQSNIRWGTADGMLGRSHHLRLPINLFINSADELYGLITTIRQNGSVVKHIPWTAFSFKPSDWDRVNDTRTVISDANNIQQYFSADVHPTLWRAIPALEELQMAWKAKTVNEKYKIYKCAIKGGLDKIGKYYTRFDEKLVYILALALHPYYKLGYIKMTWGGPEEQAAEHAAGNAGARNWHNEALQVVEGVMVDYWKKLMTAEDVEMSNTMPLCGEAGVESLESEFDQHRRSLMEKASRTSTLGWAAELRCYLNDLPSNVSKDMDIVAWWSVSHIVTASRF